MIHKYIKLDTLIKLRMVSLALSGAFTAVTGAFAIKSLVDLAENRTLLAGMLRGGYLHASDLVGAASAMIGAAILGVGVSFFAFILIYFEQRQGVPAKMRWFTEFLLGFSCVAMLGSLIATTYITFTRSARPSADGLDESLLVTIIEGTGKHLAYKTTMAYYTTIFGWIAAFFLFTDLILLIMAGLRYRRQDRERKANSAAVPAREFNEESKDAHLDSSAHVDRV